MTNTNWTLVGPLIGAIVAAVGLLFAEHYRRREKIQTIVDRSVDARLGQVFREFSEFEASAKTALKSAQEGEEQLLSRLDTLRERLEASESFSQRLDQLLGNAAETVSTLERAESIPALLLEHARAVNTEPPAALGYLSTLYSSPDASSDELEIGGDIAAGIKAYGLAVRLYEKAVSVGPSNATAHASLIRVRSRQGMVPTEQAINDISELARAHPYNRTVLGEAFNTCVQADDYGACKSLAEAILDTHPQSAIAWRNLAAAREELGFPAPDVDDAYEKALVCSKDDPDERVDIIHTAQLYVSFLIGQHEYNHAREVVRRGLDADPSSELLLILYGDIEMTTSGNQETAKWCYQQVADNGGKGRRIALTRLANMTNRNLLLTKGVLTREGLDAKMTEADAESSTDVAVGHDTAS